MKTQMELVLATIGLLVPMIEAFGTFLGRTTRVNIKTLALCVGAAASLGSAASAKELVTNGSFSDPLGGTTTFNFINSPGTIPNWTLSGPVTGFWNAAWIYDSGGSVPPLFMPLSYRSCLASAGFQSGAACANPDGLGYFVNLDGDPSFPAEISQPISISSSSLVKGHTYQLTFDWAAVQRSDESGQTSDEYLTASLGDQSFDTTNIFCGSSPGCVSGLFLPSQGFSGWFTTSINITWDGVGNVLSLLAHGAPSGLPPSVDLASISLIAVPEPSSWAMLITGLGLLGVAARRRRRTVAGS